MMHEREKSGLAVVAMKPTNKAERSAAELGEPRAGAEGNVGQHSTDRATVSQGLERIRQFAAKHPRWQPYAGKPLVRFWCSEASCYSSG